MARRSSARSMSRMSTPSRVTEPCVTSYRRGMSWTRVDLPQPVEPMMAVVRPGSAVKLMCSSIGQSASG